MRMWMIDAKLLCRNHLLGEHSEIHKHRPSFVKRHRIDRRIAPIVQIEPESMENRHETLAVEMMRRGYKHNSPYEQPDLSYLSDEQRCAKVDLAISLIDLAERCPECLKRMREYSV